MLKGIPALIGPDLLKVLYEMGHGDSIVIADGNFPAASIAGDTILIRMDGHGVPEILESILKLIPLDQYADTPVTLMERCEGDPADISIWDRYRSIIGDADPRGADVIGTLERFSFYEEAKKAYAVIATSETSQYANVILKKGCIL
ncbi:MAG: fucose isomerase [Butyrivibrio sp.]|nr:fucose isomerase [Butyrivibrio sp.]